MDVRDVIIQNVVPHRTFVDVGALWGTVNEKVSVASRAGAASVAVIDEVPLGAPLWTAFDDRMVELGIAGVRRVSANLDRLPEPVERFDVVHCSGIVYHCPNPIFTLGQLRLLTGEWLILTSMVVPETIDSAIGSIRIGSGQALFVPGLDAPSRAIVDRYLFERDVRGAIGIDQPVERWDPTNYDPWWWLLTPSAVATMLRVAGFTVEADAPYWDGRAHTFLARRADTAAAPPVESIGDEVQHLRREVAELRAELGALRKAQPVDHQLVRS